MRIVNEQGYENWLQPNTTHEDENNIIELLMSKQIIVKSYYAGFPNCYTISPTLLKELEYDCLNDAERIMYLYNKGEIIPKGTEAVYSCVDGNEKLLIGDLDKSHDQYQKTRNNVNKAKNQGFPINESVIPEVGKAFFICRMYPTTGILFPYHAAAIICESEGWYYTLETYTYNKKPYWFFRRYSSSLTNTYHEKNCAEYNPTEKKYRDMLPVTILIKIRNRML